MNLSQSIASLTLLAMTASSAAANARGDRDDAVRAESRVSIRLVSTATGGQCNAETDVVREATVCTDDGCSTIDLSQRRVVSFELGALESHSVEIMTTANYRDGSELHGFTTSDFLRGSEIGSGRVTHSVVGKDGCIESFVYQVER